LDRVAKCLPKNKGLTTGHEFVGEIVSFGPCTNPSTIQLHDRVVIVPLLPCGKCDWCQMGFYSHCPDYSFLGSRQDGGTKQYISIPVKNLIHIPDGIDNEGATFVEPLTVAIHAILKFKSLVGSTAVIIGSGTIGLLCLQVFKKLGVDKVAVVDIVPEKLELAKKLGADLVCNSLENDAMKSLDVALEKSLHTVVIESSGSAVGKNNAIRFSRPLGEIVYIGGLSSSWTIDDEIYQQILRKELVMNGSWMNYSAPFPGREWNIAIDLLRKSEIDYRSLITHRFPLKEVNKAFDVLFDKHIVSIKVLIDTQIV
jgi:threonine dehydrogenase-like Zn-dependent dehydrogenase